MFTSRQVALHCNVCAVSVDGSEIQLTRLLSRVLAFFLMCVSHAQFAPVCLYVSQNFSQPSCTLPIGSHSYSVIFMSAHILVVSVSSLASVHLDGWPAQFSASTLVVTLHITLKCLQVLNVISVWTLPYTFCSLMSLAGQCSAWLFLVLFCVSSELVAFTH